MLANGCTSQEHRPEHVQLTVTPAHARLDEPVAIRVDGLPAGERATLTASAVDTFRVTWFSRTTFVASSTGVVDTRQRPVSGSYDDVDPMGVIDRMKPTSRGADEVVFIPPALGYRVTITVTVGGRPVAHRDVTRAGEFDEHERSFRLPQDDIYAN